MKYRQWRLRFKSEDNTKEYALYIYKEADVAPTITELVGAAEPFVTSEDGSEDIWEPVRGQTGTLSIVSNSLTILDELMPIQDFDRPVLLVRMVGTSEVVEWCGYLTSESYSQPYNSRMQQIDINVRSVVASLESRQYDRLELGAYCTIADLLYKMNIGSEPNAWGAMNILVPTDSQNILTKYIYTDWMYDVSESVSDTGVQIDVKSKSAKDIMGAICGLMGWTLRENHYKIVCYKHDYEGEYNEYDMQRIFDQDGHFDPVDTHTTNKIRIDDSEYCGTGHNRSVVSGAKRVRVKAKTDAFSSVMSMYDVKYAHLCDDRTTTNMPPYTYRYKWVFYYKDNYENNLVQCSQRKFTTTDGESKDGGTATFDNLKYYLWGAGKNTNAKYVGAAKVRMVHEYNPKFYRHTSGLYMQMCNTGTFNIGNVAYANDPAHWNMSPIYVQESEKPVHLYGGYLKLSISQYDHNFDNGTGTENEYASIMYMAIRVGNMEWMGQWYGQSSGWHLDLATNPQYRFKVPFDKDKNLTQTSKPLYVEGDGFYIPINNGNEDIALDGVVKVYIYPMLSVASVDEDGNYTPVTYVRKLMLESIDVEYISPKEFAHTSDISENEYVGPVHGKYREEVEKTIELATDRNNSLSDHILRLSDKYPLTQLVYRKNGTNVGIRPESNLINRMEAYYWQNRSIFELDIAKDMRDLVKVSWYGGKLLAPMSVEMNWKTGRHKVKCFEYQPEDNTGYISTYVDPTSSDMYDTDPSERDTDWEANSTAPDVDAPDVNGPDGDE